MAIVMTREFHVILGLWVSLALVFMVNSISINKQKIKSCVLVLCQTDDLTKIHYYYT